MLTVEEKNLKFLLKIWIFSFLLAAAAFLVAPNLVIRFLNTVSLKLFPHLIPLPESTERFWLSLSGSLMVTLLFLLFGAVSDIARKKDLVFYVLVSKIASTVLFLSFFFLHQKSFTYILGGWVDGSIFLVTLFFYRRAVAAGYLQL
ncbi:MAG: hypothetical protein HQM15_11520 [Deltaproteobacteria bacterium]|nr:hypothetical protein [Deltaproteobacteria bacterium]